MDLKSIFTKVALIGAGFLVGGFFDYTLFHNVEELTGLIKTVDPMMQAFWSVTGIPWVADKLTVAFGGKSASERKAELENSQSGEPVNVTNSDIEGVNEIGGELDGLTLTGIDDGVDTTASGIGSGFEEVGGELDGLLDLAIGGLGG